MRLLCSGLVLVVFAHAAAAQTPPNVVAEHYQAYRAALDAGDVEAAEDAATLALAASEARDGDGGSTGVLALNLATTRLSLDDPASAYAAAERAHALAQGGAPNLDAAYTNLVLGRAELRHLGEAGAERLRLALANVERLRLPETEIFDAATELGAWALRERRFDLAEVAWASAATFAAGSPHGESYGYGHARTWQGAAIFYSELGRSGRRFMNLSRAHEAYGLLAEASVALAPLAAIERADLQLTVAQRSYAQTLALLGVMRAKLRSDEQPVPEGVAAQGDADGMTELPGPVDLARPRCLLRLVPDPLPEYPERQLGRSRVAGLVFRFRIDSEGEIAESSVVARVGDEAFVEAVERVAPRWRVERRENSPANCRIETTVLTPVSFSIDTPPQGGRHASMVKRSIAEEVGAVIRARPDGLALGARRSAVGKPAFIED